MRTLTLAVLAVLTLSTLGCAKSDYQGHGFVWTPPRGVSLTSDSAQEAVFSGGVRLKVVPSVGAADHEHLEAIRAALVPKTATMLTSKIGTAPAGPYARVVATENGTRTLGYYLRNGQQALVLSLTASTAEFGPLEQRLDTSMASLRLAGP